MYKQHLRGNAHIEDFTKHLFLLHWRGTRKSCRVERREIRRMANGWGGSGNATISLLWTFGVLGSAARGRSATALRLTGLRTGLPSTSVRLTGSTILRRASATVVGDVPVTLRRGRLAVRTRLDHGRVGRVTGARWDHARLTISHHTTSSRGREVIARTRREVHRTVHVARDASGSSLLHANLVALSNLTFQLLPADLTTLSEGDIERFGTNHLVVHLCNSLGGLLRSGVADETEALGMVLVVAHDLGAGNGSKRLELSTELFVIDVVVEVLDVEVDALILAQLLHLGLFVRFPQLFLTFGLLLCPGDEELLAIMLAVMEGLDGFGSIKVVLEVDESKASAPSLIVDLEDRGSDRSKLSEQVFEFFL